MQRLPPRKARAQDLQTDDIYNPDYVRDLFDHMAASYERVNYLTSFGFSIRWRHQLLQALPQTDSPIRVIDVMTGMGETWGSIRRRYPAADLSALDFSDRMLERARENNAARENGSVKIFLQDLLDNALESDQYDAVVCAFGLKTFNKGQLAIVAREIRRILKPGGRFAFVEVSAPPNRLLCTLYGFYLGRVIPVFGKILLGNPVEYRMLWRYVAQFQNSRQAHRIFEAAGLDTQYQSFFWGCATGITGQKLAVKP